jgi:hypothetical protein
LRRIERINPNFYPVPSTQIRDPITQKVVRLEKKATGYLTREEFPRIYGQCSDFLHASNPYSSDQPDLEKTRECFKVWLEKVVGLLNHHTIQLLNERLQLWVIMQTQSHDDKVTAAEMERVG